MHGSYRQPPPAPAAAAIAPVEASNGRIHQGDATSETAATPRLQHPGDVTRLLKVISNEGPEARQRLLEVVYTELHRLADSRLNGDPAHWIIRTTSMVHETYLRLIGSAEMEWKSRAHFFGAAAEAMRRILVERIRTAQTLKRGGGHSFEILDEAEVPAPAHNGEVHAVDILALHHALAQLELLDARKAEVVKLRFFAGLEVSEAALAMEISDRTAAREWEAARIWLFREMTRA